MEDLQARKEILGLPAVESDQTFFPEFQFDSDGVPYKLMRDIIEGLEPAVATPYSIAIWMTSRRESLRNKKPADLLSLGVRRHQTILREIRSTVLAVTGGQTPKI